MFNADLADTPLASYRPDIAGELDSLGDVLREALAPFVSAEKSAAAFARLDAVLEQSGATIGSEDREQIAMGILRAIYGDTSHAPEIRIIAAAALKRFGKDGRSYQAMGDEFGVTRACIHAHSRRIERRTGIKCRSDKQDSARLKSTEKATVRERTGARTSGVLRGGQRGLGGVFTIFKLRGV
jgi:hypothetical protein